MTKDRVSYEVDQQTACGIADANEPAIVPHCADSQISASSKLLDHEKVRLEEIKRYQIMDTPPEENFDRLVRLASFICGTPTSLMSLLDDRRQWFKAKVGFESDEKPRSIAFCAHAIESEDGIMIVEDTWKDQRFANNPQVTGEPHIRFYAGASMRSSAGARLGTICVVDSKPRDLTEQQRSLLSDLAALAVNEMELRLVNRQLLS